MADKAKTASTDAGKKLPPEDFSRSLERNLGIGVIIVLVCTFGFLVYRKFDRKQQEQLLQASIGGPDGGSDARPSADAGAGPSAGSDQGAAAFGELVGDSEPGASAMAEEASDLFGDSAESLPAMADVGAEPMGSPFDSLSEPAEADRFEGDADPLFGAGVLAGTEGVPEDSAFAAAAVAEETTPVLNFDDPEDANGIELPFAGAGVPGEDEVAAVGDPGVGVPDFPALAGSDGVMQPDFSGDLPGEGDADPTDTWTAFNEAASDRGGALPSSNPLGDDESIEDTGAVVFPAVEVVEARAPEMPSDPFPAINEDSGSTLLAMNEPVQESLDDPFFPTPQGDGPGGLPEAGFAGVERTAEQQPDLNETAAGSDPAEISFFPVATDEAADETTDDSAVNPFGAGSDLAADGTGADQAVNSESEGEFSFATDDETPRLAPATGEQPLLAADPFPPAADTRPRDASAEFPTAALDHSPPFPSETNVAGSWADTRSVLPSRSDRPVIRDPNTRPAAYLAADGSFSLAGWNYQNGTRATEEIRRQSRWTEVRAGENYWAVSRRIYGTARYFSALAIFNQHRIPDPKTMRQGMKILVPEAEQLTALYPELFPELTRERKVALPTGFFLMDDGHPAYRVGERETLSEISQRHLGRASAWIRIFELNRDHLKNPDNLRPGTVLLLPEDASSVTLLP